MKVLITGAAGFIGMHVPNVYWSVAIKSLGVDTVDSIILIAPI
jgi:UDP-glucose 4-epimerase